MATNRSLACVPAGFESEEEIDDEQRFDEPVDNDVRDEDLRNADRRINKRPFQPRYSSRSFNNIRFKNEIFTEPEEELEHILNVAGLDHLMPIFTDQGIGLYEFLLMNESDFEKLGINQMGERKRLVQLVADIHTKSWAEKSLTQPIPYFCSLAAVKVISGVHGHLVCMEASLVYLRQIAEQKRIIEPIDLDNFKKLLREVNDTITQVPIFEKRLRELYESLKQLPNTPGITFKQSDSVGEKKGTLNIEIMKKALLVFAVPLGFYFIWRVHPRKHGSVSICASDSTSLLNLPAGLVLVSD